MVKKSTALSFVGAFTSISCASVLPPVLLSIEGKHIFFSSIVIAAIAILLHARKVSQIFVPYSLYHIVSAMLALGLVAFLFSEQPSQLLILISFSATVLVAYMLSTRMDRAVFVNIYAASAFILGFLGALSIILYSIAPTIQATVTVPDTGRTLGWIYITLSDSTQRGVLRPAGLFDEPGGFAVFILVAAMLKHMENPRSIIVPMLMLLSLTTASLMAVFVVLWYVAIEVSKSPASLISKRFLIPLFILLPLAIQLSDILVPYFADRLVIEDGSLSGDNRTGQIKDFFAILDPEIFLMGVEGGAGPRYLQVGIDQSSNPFSIIYNYGIFAWLPYFFALCFLAASIFKAGPSRLAAGSLLLILLVRPHLLDYRWMFMFSFLLVFLATSRLGDNSASGGQVHGNARK